MSSSSYGRGGFQSGESRWRLGETHLWYGETHLWPKHRLLGWTETCVVCLVGVEGGWHRTGSLGHRGNGTGRMTRAGPGEGTPGPAERGTSQGLAQTRGRRPGASLVAAGASPRGHVLPLGLGWVSAGWGGRRRGGRKAASPEERPPCAGVARGQPASRAAGRDPRGPPARSQVGRGGEGPGGEGGSSPAEPASTHPASTESGVEEEGASRRRPSPCPRRWAQRAGGSAGPGAGRRGGTLAAPRHPPPPPGPSPTPFPARGPETARAPPGRWRWGRAHTCPDTLPLQSLPPLGTAPSAAPGAGGRWR